VLESLLELLLAVEVVLAPVWIGAVVVRPPARLTPRLVRTFVGMVLAGAALLILALVVGGGAAASPRPWSSPSACSWQGGRPASSGSWDPVPFR